MRSGKAGISKWRWLLRASITLAAAAIACLALWASGSRFGHWHQTRKQPTTQADIHPPAASLPQPLSKATETGLALEFPGIKTSVEKTPQKLLLMGTILGRNSHEGSAFIGVDARNPQTYVAGAVLANGARVTEIFKDYVVLEQRGRTARLYLQNRQAAGLPTGTAEPLLFVGMPDAFTPAKSTSSEIFTDFIRPTPVYAGTALTGFEVYPGKNAAVFNQWGLHAGDVVLRIAGSPFSDPSQAMESFRQLAEGSSTIATISRGGHELEIQLDGSLIAAALARDSASTTPALVAAGTN